MIYEKGIEPFPKVLEVTTFLLPHVSQELTLEKKKSVSLHFFVNRLLIFSDKMALMEKWEDLGYLFFA